MKIYAKQVPPEYQESPLYMGDWPENVFVFGNRHYNDHSGRLEDIRRGLENISDIYDDMRNGESWTRNGNLGAAMWYELPRDDGRGYSRAERLELVKLAQKYCDCSSSKENNVLCAVLELVTGQEYDAATIRGCCQGDWQNIIYPAEYGREWLEAFEAEYFNTGEQWIVDPDGENLSVYVTGWSDEQKRAEIADAAGCDPGDVVLYAFDGWSRIPNYSEVYA